MKKTAEEYIKAGLNPLPFVEGESRPAISWQAYQKQRVTDLSAFSRAKAIGSVCGEISGGLEVVDVDVKYDLTGHLWDDFKRMLQENIPKTFPNLTIAKTRNGGYHIYYRCKIIEGAKVLAARETTPEEREKNPRDKIRPLIETRGEGGVIAMPPTPGYEFIQGDANTIPDVSSEVRGYIWHIAKSLTEISPEEDPPREKTPEPIDFTPKGETPREAYNKRGDVLSLLERHGWKQTGRSGDRIFLLRPGETKSKSSGNYHTTKRTLRVFSTSSEFDPGKAYCAYDVYALLEHNGDHKAAYKELVSQGYGEPLTKKENKPEEKPADFANIFNTSPSLQDMINHYSKEPEGLRTGYSVSGQNLVLPSSALSAVAGATGHGKTAMLINLCLNAVINHPEKEFYFLSYEMSQEDIVCRFINCYLYSTGLDEDLQRYSNIKGIKSFFKNRSSEYIRVDAKEGFESGVKRFFQELIGTGRLRIKGVDYLAPDLCQLIPMTQQKGDTGGVFIDYFQLLKLPSDGYKMYSRQEELKMICILLNEVAKDTGLPVVLGTQFNRTMTNPLEMHPTQLSEAGDIERILNLLIGIWNSAYPPVGLGGKDKKKATVLGICDQDGEPAPGSMYVKLLKNREGEVNLVDILGYSAKRELIRTNGADEEEDAPF